MKHSNENIKNIIKLLLILTLVIILGFCFLSTWLSKYNVLLRYPYLFKGNIFLMFIYMILLYIFMIIYDCDDISHLRLSNLVFSESLAIISTNILVYFVMIIPAAALGLMPFRPIVILTIFEIFIIFVWCIAASNIMKKLFPPNKMLLISNNDSVENEIYRFSSRNDIYNICETIKCNNNLSEIYNKCDKYDYIIIGDITSEERNDIIKYCFDGFKNMYVIPKLSDILLKYSYDTFSFDTPIYVVNNFGISLEQKFFKRIFDVIISLLVLILFLPIWVLVAILIKIEDGGPIFFVQERATINNDIFDILKFRSMKTDTDSSVVLPTIEDDPRITNVGKIIRKLHIDEIPQFINVLLGDMSVVGPRPERIEHVMLYQNEIKEFKFRSKVKAGITGLAQIYGKYNTSAVDKLKLDLIYIKKYSLRLDIELLFRTLKVLIIKDNTEGFDKKSQEFIKNNAKY